MTTALAPQPPPPLRPARFPVLPIIAPAVLSLIFLLVFRSPFALIIGVVGPAMAITQWWESRRSSARDHAEASENYAEQLARFHDGQEQMDEAFRKEQLLRFPAVSEWPLHPLWRPVVRDNRPVIRIGLTVATGRSGAQLTAIPATVELQGGVAVVGGHDSALKVWRTVALGLLACHEAHFHADRPSQWNPADFPPDSLEIAGIMAQRVQTSDHVARNVRTVIVVHSPDSLEVFRDGVADSSPIRPDLLSAAQAQRLAMDLMPHNTTDSVDPPPDPSDRSHLVAWLDSEQWIDLVSDGPHGVIWGQTGSGKTILLRTIIRSIAHRYRPDQAQCVVIDFKGGLGISDLTDIPHLVGALTDLEPHQTTRVRQGIAAEIRRRERLLTTEGVSDLAELPPHVECPRTLVVIDELGTLLQTYPEWSTLVSDLASRGRALGLHLLVAGQRVVGQVPPAVLANAPLRVCLRVSSVSEASEFLPGVPRDVLHQLSAASPGTAVIHTLSRQHRMVRVSEDPGRSVLPGRGVPLWQPSLPERIAATDHSTLAIVDKPDDQWQGPLVAGEVPRGLVWVIGDPGSGHTTLLSRLAETLAPDTAVSAFHEPALFVDQLLRLQCTPSSAWPPVILVDRLDRVLAGVDSELIQWVVEAIVSIAQRLADNPVPGRLVVTTVGEGELPRLLGRHRQPDFALPIARHDVWNQWGLPATHWSGNTPPGRISINGQVAQIVSPDSLLATPEDIHWPAVDTRAPGEAPWLVLCPGQADTSIPPDWEVLSVADVPSRWAELDQAYRDNRLLLWSLSSSAVRGHLRIQQELPAAPPPLIWRVGVTGAELVTLPEA